MFPYNDNVNVVRSIMTAEIGAYGNPDGPKDDLLVSLTIREGETIVEALKHLREILNRYNDQDLKELSCNHDWQFAPGCTSTIGCGHGNPQCS